MPHIYRITNGPDLGDIVQAVDDLKAFARAHGPGCYHIDEITSDPLPSGHTSRRWGLAISHPDGSVELEPDPWEA